MSLEQQLAKPFRDLNKTVNDIILSYSLSDRAIEEKLSTLNYTHEIVYRDGLRCYVIHFNLRKINSVQFTSFNIVLKERQGSYYRRFYIISSRHFPRRSDKYLAMILDDAEQHLYSRLTINRLPSPFPTNCRDYSPLFESREQCLESCVKSKIAANYNHQISTRVTYSANEIVGKQFSYNFDRIIFHSCSDKCKQVDCSTEIYSIETKTESTRNGKEILCHKSVPKNDISYFCHLHW